MTTKIGKIVADFETQLSAVLGIGGTSVTLQSVLDDDGVVLANGTYLLTLDRIASNKEYIIATLTVTGSPGSYVGTLTAINNVSRQGVVGSSGAAQKHRVGATCGITDFADLQIFAGLLGGTSPLLSTSPLYYDASFTPTVGQFQVAAWDYIKSYVDGVTTSGAPDASVTTRGINQLTAAPLKPIGTATITIANPAVITCASHGMNIGNTVKFTTTGALPTGIVAGTSYYVIALNLTTNTFEISASQGGAAVATSGSQSGVHTLVDLTPRALGESDARVIPLNEAQALAANASPAASTTNYFLKKTDIGVPATITASTLSFTASTHTISDSGSGFVTAGFVPGMQINTSGFASNNGTYTVVSVAAGSIVVAETLVDESAGSSGTIAGAINGKIPVYNPAGIIPGSTFSLLAGAALTAGQSLHITKYYQSDGGIQLDTQLSKNFANTTNSVLSFSVANNPHRLILIEVVATAVPTLVQYSGVTATLIDSQSDGSKTVYTYYLLAPAITTANIAVTCTGIYGISGASYYNVAQSTPPVSAKGTNGNVSVSLSIATGGQCRFIHVFGFQGSSGGTIASATTQYTSKYINSQNGATVVDTNGQNYVFSSSVAEFDEAITNALTISAAGGSGTVNTTAMAIVIAPFTAPATALMPTDSSAITNNEPKIKHVGFAAANVSKDAIATVSFGLVSGLTSLSTGDNYYLQDTPGVYGTSPGTYGRSIGMAISSTQLNMDFASLAKSQLTAISKVTGFTYTAECDGMLIGRAGQNSTVTIASSSAQAGATANYLTPITYPIGKGQTYIFTLTGSNGSGIFIPYI